MSTTDGRLSDRRYMCCYSVYYTEPERSLVDLIEVELGQAELNLAHETYDLSEAKNVKAGLEGSGNKTYIFSKSNLADWLGKYYITPYTYDKALTLAKNRELAVRRVSPEVQLKIFADWAAHSQSKTHLAEKYNLSLYSVSKLLKDLEQLVACESDSFYFPAYWVGKKPPKSLLFLEPGKEPTFLGGWGFGFIHKDECIEQDLQVA